MRLSNSTVLELIDVVGSLMAHPLGECSLIQPQQTPPRRAAKCVLREAEVGGL